MPRVAASSSAGGVRIALRRSTTPPIEPTFSIGRVDLIAATLFVPGRTLGAPAVAVVAMITGVELGRAYFLKAQEGAGGSGSGLGGTGSSSSPPDFSSLSTTCVPGTTGSSGLITFATQ